MKDFSTLAQFGKIEINDKNDNKNKNIHVISKKFLASTFEYCFPLKENQA